MSWRLPILLVPVALAGCGGGGGGAAPATVATADLSKSRLQFAVGTAVFPSTENRSTIGPILNLVETFRQPNGTTALLEDTPAITGPPGFVASSGIGLYDGGAPNQLINSLSCASAFGESFGVNLSGVSQLPSCIGSASGSGAFTIGVGGPPAFPRTTDGNYPAGFTYTSNVIAIGANETFFKNGFPLGNYTLQVSTPPGSSESHTWTASAKLVTMNTLPVLAAPLLSFDGNGGGSVSFSVPPKITELFVSISATDSCWPFEAATNTVTSAGTFSLFLKAPKVGPLTVAIPDNLGPPIANGNAPTFCSAAQNTAAVGMSTTGAPVSVQLVGVDYPLYEMSYPQSTVQLPQITGSTQSDVTVSATTSVTAP